MYIRLNLSISYLIMINLSLKEKHSPSFLCFNDCMYCIMLIQGPLLFHIHLCKVKKRQSDARNILYTQGPVLLILWISQLLGPVLFGANAHIPLPPHFNSFQPTVVRKFHFLSTSTHLNLLQPMLVEIFFTKFFRKKFYFPKIFLHKFLFRKFVFEKIFFEIFFRKFFLKLFFWKLYFARFILQIFIS